MNIPSAPAELKSQILYSSDRNITYNLRNTTKTTLYLPKTNNHYGELTFKYFFNLFVEKICIKHIKMLFIDFKKHILLNIKSYWKFFWRYLKILTFRTKKCVLLTTKRRKNNFCLSNSYYSF